MESSKTSSVVFSIVRTGESTVTMDVIYNFDDGTEFNDTLQNIPESEATVTFYNILGQLGR